MTRYYSSRVQSLGESYLRPHLENAVSYDRIAGYFSSSMLEVAGDLLGSMPGRVRILCNAEVARCDVETARFAVGDAVREDWAEQDMETVASQYGGHLRQLYDMIRAGKLEIRIIPTSYFRFLHGKTGLIRGNGWNSVFTGSANETLAGWERNYEILWADDCQEAVDWFTSEFEPLWNSSFAIPLEDSMVEELGRVASREVISMDGWRELDDPEEQIASVMNEVRMVRRGCEIWPHQRYFVDLAYRRHISPWGCRVVLADTVGLGKTIQTGMVLKLAALSGDKPILVLLPPSLMIQWQEELSEMLGVPSARLSRNYSGSLWITNDGRKTPNRKEPVLLNCPTRIGLVSTGLVNNGSDEILDQILSMEYDCVVVDEAHHARWHLPGMGVSGRKYETIHKNKLYTFLEKLAPRTHSLLLATATPVQLELMELHDLLRLLSLTQTGENIVLGNDRSFWNQNAKSAMETILRPENYDSGSGTISNWEVFRNPISPFPEDGFLAIRQHLGMKESAASGQAEDFERLLRGDRDKIHSLFCGEQPEFLRKHNPVIRSVVRRERVNLEQQINEKTGKPYLRKIDVVETSGRLNLSTPMMDAYHCAQRFCSMLQGTGKGLRETLLLRRIGSSIQAGKITAQNFLDNGKIVTDLDEENDFADERDYDTPAENSQEKNGKNPLILTSYQITLLQNLLRHLDNAGDDDPKQQKVFDLLEKEKWLESGCVIFSQYYDTADWIADVLVERFPDEVIGLYAGGGRARVWQNESWHEETRDNIKKRVLSGEIRLLVSTDAGAEGLNLQALANLINLDLPWNPTKLIQRLGRLCRPGQRRDYVNVCNLMYIDSVEAKVFNILSQRFQTITELFGVLPDCLSSIWRDMAKDDVTGEASVRQEADRLSRIIEDNPFQEKYNATVKPMEWERIRKVLHAKDMEKVLRKGWKTP